MSDTVIIRKTGKGKLTLEFSKLPGQPFGPYPWTEAKGQLEFAADLPSPEARNAIFDALVTGEATVELDD
jgi:hypothetical protein